MNHEELLVKGSNNYNPQNFFLPDKSTSEEGKAFENLKTEELQRSCQIAQIKAAQAQEKAAKAQEKAAVVQEKLALHQFNLLNKIDCGQPNVSSDYNITLENF